MKRPEILSPAGDREKMKFALFYGADAVYLAGKAYGMRAASANFTDEELIEAVSFAHARSAKVYVTVNVMPREKEFADLERYLRFLNDEARPDAIIVSDLGVMALAARVAPDTALHISTQGSTVNAETCLVYRSMGAKRVVLARELTLDEIRAIRDRVPGDVELEAFVHGAMCVSYSGRCLLSNALTGRDANHGACAQPCRFEYFEHEKAMELIEKKRPEEPFSVIEHERGTYIFSSKDLCMIAHIPELVESGIDSFKIEGRVKSAYYAAVTANAYKTEVLRYLSDPASYVFDGRQYDELCSVSHREYGTGYFFDDPMQNAQIVREGGYVRDKAFLATVEDVDENAGRAILYQRNKACEGDACELVSPGKASVPFVLTDLRDADGNKIDSAPHPKMRYSVRTVVPMKVGDIVRGGY